MLDTASDPVALYGEALRLVDQGHDTEASARLDAAIMARPDFGEAFALGAFVLERGGKRDIALRFYQRALTLKPDQPIAWFNLAKLLLREGRFPDALQALDAGFAHSPGDADALNTLSALLRSLWRLEEAAEAARASSNRPSARSANASLQIASA